MKVRNLIAKYCNLQPAHVEQEGILLGTTAVSAEKYKELFDYARQLELDVKAKNATIMLYKTEVRKVNLAMNRKHVRLKKVNDFMEASYIAKRLFTEL